MASSPALDIFYTPTADTPLLLELLYAALDAYGPVAMHEQETADGFRVFFRVAADRDAARMAIDAGFGSRLAGIAPVDVADEDWARRSQAQLTAIRAGRIVVAPPWDPAAARVNSHRLRPDFVLRTSSRPRRSAPRGGGQGFGESTEALRATVELPTPNSQAPTPNSQSAHSHDAGDSTTIIIVIEPSMGFGTGHHATTRLCLELVQELDVSGRSVVDVGTGSGVLAIAAAKLGAAAVVAIDHDPDALQNARDNVRANGVAQIVDLREVDLSALDLPPADVVLANLTGAVLQRFARELRALVRPDGRLVVSGFAPEELKPVVGAIGGTAVRDVRDGDWCAALLA